MRLVDGGAGGRGTGSGKTTLLDHQGTAVPYQGLLGMNFLEGMNYIVDFEKQTIRWAQ